MVVLQIKCSEEVFPGSTWKDRRVTSSCLAGLSAAKSQGRSITWRFAACKSPRLIEMTETPIIHAFPARRACGSAIIEVSFVAWQKLEPMIS
jgi:hypothetical protein